MEKDKQQLELPNSLIDPEPSKALLYNENVTQEKNSSPIMKHYLKWCETLGIKTSRTLYPAHFGPNGELRGMVALEDLEPYHTVISIPVRSTHILSKGESLPLLKETFAKYPNVFCAKHSSFADMNRYLLYLIYDFTRGQESEYYEYFKISDDPGAIWVQGEYYDLIYNRRLRDDIDEQNHRIGKLWESFSKILDEVPNLTSRKISRDEFIYCFHFSSCRTFYYHLPSIFAAPGLDMMNHNDTGPHFRRTIINKVLENASDEECAKVKYTKVCQVGDLSTIFDDIKVKPKHSETRPLRFIEVAGEVVQDSSRISISQEEQLAHRKGLELLKNIARLQIWNIPNWIGFRQEHSQSPLDIVENKADFDCQLARLKEILQNPAGFEQTKKTQQEFILQRAGENFYDPNDLNPENFPWFHHDDPNNYAIMYNSTGKILQAGQQPYLHYGKNTNRFLLKNYGFALEKNIYDSLPFYLVPEKQESSEVTIQLEAGLPSDDIKQQLGLEYRSKMHQLNVELFIEIKRRVSLRSQSLRTQKESLDLELSALAKYQELFEQYLSSHLRKRNEYLELLEKHKDDFRARVLLYCELGQLEIAERQIHLASICKKVVENCTQQDSLTEESFKAAYMKVFDASDNLEGTRASQDLIAIGGYLHLLFSTIGI